MAGAQEVVTTAAAVTAGGDLVPWAGARPGPVAIAAELLARTRAELPVLAGLGEREELLAAAWLASLRAPRTRRAYAGDVRGWLGWLAERGVDVLGAGRVHVDVWVGRPAGPGRGVFHRTAAAVGAVQLLPLLRRPRPGRPDPDGGVARPMVDPDYTATIGLDRDQVRALVAAADADRGRRRCGRRRWSGCWCTMRCGWTRPAPSMSPTSAPTPATGSCACSVRAPGRRESRWPSNSINEEKVIEGALVKLTHSTWLVIRSLPVSMPAPHCAMCRTTPATRTLAPPARACPGQPGPQRRPRGRGLPRLTRPLRLRPRADPLRRRGRSRRGRQRFPPRRLSRSIRPIRPCSVGMGAAREINVIEHRPPGPLSDEQLSADRRVRRWLTAGP